jgi:glycerol-3-phosphate dehydrogenase subunit C
MNNPTLNRPLAWKDAKFYDKDDLDQEIRRVFDICNGCRRCFNLCGLFPKLFDRMDSPEIDGDVEKLTSEHIAEIIPSCTLCDMCFMVKCPYVPPHPWNVDFPRLMLRYRAVQKKSSFQAWVSKRLAHIDTYAPLASACAPVTNAVLGCGCARKAIEPLTHIDRRAQLPRFRSRKNRTIPLPNPEGKAFGKTVCLYTTCAMTYYVSRMVEATLRLLAHWGLTVRMRYPGCCGMPLWEQGALKATAKQAKKIAKTFREEDVVIPLTPSCTLMLQSEWPALCPDNPDVLSLAKKTKDLSEFIASIMQEYALLSEAKTPFPEGIALHMACHVRAQNKGNPSHILLRQLPETPVRLVERCSGHGGMWGYKKEHFQEALDVGKPVIKQSESMGIVATECPLAHEHLVQSLKLAKHPARVMHPIELLAESILGHSPSSETLPHPNKETL